MPLLAGSAKTSRLLSMTQHAGERLVEELAPELVPMLQSIEMPANFVPVTNAVLAEMARRGVGRQQILTTLRTMGTELPQESVELIQVETEPLFSPARPSVPPPPHTLSTSSQAPSFLPCPEHLSLCFDFSDRICCCNCLSVLYTHLAAFAHTPFYSTPRRACPQRCAYVYRPGCNGIPTMLCLCVYRPTWLQRCAQLAAACCSAHL